MLDGDLCRRIAVESDHQRTGTPRRITEGVGAFACGLVAALCVEPTEVSDPSEEVTRPKERGDLAVIPLHMVGADRVTGPWRAVLHAVALALPLPLSVTEHRHARECRRQRCRQECTVANPKSHGSRLLVGGGEEVHIASQQLRVVGRGVAQDRAVLRVLAVTEHRHKGGVVDAVHAESAHEIPLKEPEGLGEQHRARELVLNAFHYFAPELPRQSLGELSVGQRKFGARGDRGSGAARRIPEPPNVLCRKGHRRIEANDVGAARHGENLLDDRLARLCIQVVDLGGVLPRHVRAVVAVIDVLQRAFRAALKGDSGIITPLIAIFDANRSPWLR